MLEREAPTPSPLSDGRPHTPAPSPSPGHTGNAGPHPRAAAQADPSGEDSRPAGATRLTPPRPPRPSQRRPSTALMKTATCPPHTRTRTCPTFRRGTRHLPSHPAIHLSCSSSVTRLPFGDGDRVSGAPPATAAAPRHPALCWPRAGTGGPLPAPRPSERPLLAARQLTGPGAPAGHRELCPLPGPLQSPAPHIPVPRSLPRHTRSPAGTVSGPFALHPR